MNKKREKILKEFYAIFDMINYHCFDNKIAQAEFEIVPYIRGAQACVAPSYKIQISAKEIGISNENIIGVIAHEMVHIWQWQHCMDANHNRSFYRRLEALGAFDDFVGYECKNQLSQVYIWYCGRNFDLAAAIGELKKSELNTTEDHCYFVEYLASKNIVDKSEHNELDKLLSVPEINVKSIGMFIRQCKSDLSKLLEYSLFEYRLFQSDLLNNLTKEEIYLLYQNTTDFKSIVCNCLIKPEIRALFWWHIYRKSSDSILMHNERILYIPALAIFNIPREFQAKRSNRNIKKILKLLLGDIKYDILPLEWDDRCKFFDILRNDHVKELHDFLCEREIIVNTTIFFRAAQNASVKIFKYLFENYSDVAMEISIHGWMFLLILENAFYNEEFSIEILNFLEHRFPGNIASCRDPLGNDLLWYTLGFSGTRPQKLQNELIKLGCNPHAINSLGLSFNLVRENSPDKWESGLGVCAEN